MLPSSWGKSVQTGFQTLKPEADQKAHENLLFIPPLTNILGIRNESFNFPFKYDNTKVTFLNEGPS